MRCVECEIEWDLGQQKAVDELLNGVYPTICFKCGKPLTE